MVKAVIYADEFVRRFRELSHGQRSLVEDSVRTLLSVEDPTLLSHHLERRAYYCNWSHRVKGNLIVVFGFSKKTLMFLSTGTHSQAYRPS